MMVVNYFMAMRSALFEQFNPGEGNLCQHFHYIYLTIKKKKRRKQAMKILQYTMQKIIILINRRYRTKWKKKISLESKCELI